MSSTIRKNVFVSYSHKDESFLLELLEQLKPYERAGPISKWSDKDIAPGSNRIHEIKAALTATRVAVMLVSPSFLASDFIHEHELGPLLKEAEAGGVRILWIPVRACSWKATPLKQYQAAISPDIPLAQMGAERDKAWVTVCEAIVQALGLISPPSLKNLLDSVLITSSDFDAFCINCFPDVYRYFVEGMERSGKLNLLLALGNVSTIQTSLQEAYPDRVELFNRHRSGLSAKEKQRQASAGRLKELLRKRAVLVEYDNDLTRIDGEIDREKKTLRQGPRVKKGEILSERYQLVQKISQGGAYGEIWLAQDLRLDATFAIKILHGKWNDRAEIVTRFTEVAKQVASISHPHVISILSPALEWEEFHYFVMEYLAGGDLHNAVLRDRDGRRKRTFLHKLSQVGNALTCLHSKGLVHRDVKPQNILLDAKGSAKLGDFDLLGGDILQRCTETGEARGTFLYAAPEQFGNAAHASARADIHALGRTALFIVYGRDLPIQASDDRIRFVEALPITAALKRVIVEATDPNPAKRHPTVAAFCAALEASLSDPDALSCPQAAVQLANTVTHLSRTPPASAPEPVIESLRAIPEASIASDAEFQAMAPQTATLSPLDAPRQTLTTQLLKTFVRSKRISYIFIITMMTVAVVELVNYLIVHSGERQIQNSVNASAPVNPGKQKEPVSPTASDLVPDLRFEAPPKLAVQPDLGSPAEVKKDKGWLASSPQKVNLKPAQKAIVSVNVEERIVLPDLEVAVASLISRPELVRQRELVACYTTFLRRNPEASGTLMYDVELHKFLVDLSPHDNIVRLIGGSLEKEVLKATLSKRPNLDDCVQHIISQWGFSGSKIINAHIKFTLDFSIAK